MAMGSPRGGLQQSQCSQSLPFILRHPLAVLVLFASVWMCSNFVDDTSAAEFKDASQEANPGSIQPGADEATEPGNQGVKAEQLKEEADTASEAKESSKGQSLLKEAGVRLQDLSIHVLLKGDFEATIKEAVDQAPEDDFGRVNWKQALESHCENLDRRGKASMNVSFVAKAPKVGDSDGSERHTVGYLLGRVERDGVFLQTVYSPVPFPKGADVCIRLISRFLEAASKEAGATLRVTAFADSSNLNACQAFNKLGLYPREAKSQFLRERQEANVTYKWISSVPYSHPTGFIEKLVEKESQTKENLIVELSKVCRSKKQLAEALKGKDWLSRKEVLQVVKDGETMLNAQQWLSQRQEFSENIGIFSERNLEFRVCFIARSKDTKMVAGVIHGQYVDKRKQVLEMALLLETVGDTRTGLYLLNAAINAIPARVTRVQALLPFTELGAMQALLQSGMSFSGVDSRNAVFGLKAPKDALDRRRLELHKARLDLRCEIEQLQRTLESFSTAEKRKQKRIAEKAKAKKEDKSPSDDSPTPDSKASVLPPPLREPWTDLPSAPSTLFPRKPREAERVETVSRERIEPSKHTEEELPSKAKSDESKAKRRRSPKEESHADEVHSKDRSGLSAAAVGAIIFLGVVMSLAIFLIKKREGSKNPSKRMEPVIRAVEKEVENDIERDVWNESELPDDGQSQLKASASNAHEG